LSIVTIPTRKADTVPLDRTRSNVQCHDLYKFNVQTPLHRTPPLTVKDYTPLRTPQPLGASGQTLI